ncbi:MAG: chlorite dismutase family protein [Actinomycetota bacterium]|jgi:chlorite dismutase
MSTQSQPVIPSTGLTVLHLFCHNSEHLDNEVFIAGVKAAQAEGAQVITAAMLGHKCDVAIMALHADMRVLRRLQARVQVAGLTVSDSYVSITEVSEYAKNMPAEMLQPRLYPVLPPEGKHAFCFYPMSKRREQGANWFTLPYEERAELMQDHGKSGRTFAGRIVQLITASSGLDEFEWGVTLFGNHVDDLKDVVYTMRFDRASAIFADFGQFYVGMVTPPEQLFVDYK